MPETLSLYSWGANSHGQLGLGDIEEEEVLVPRKVHISPALMPDLGLISQIVGGAGHTLILSHRGEVFSCGWNDKGQAGVPASSSTFQKVEALSHEDIVFLACGWDSSMALTLEGDVYVWGSNSHGQLGLKDVDKVLEPRKLVEEVNGRKIKKISMGLRHSAIVSTDGELLVSGASNKGQLGVDLHGARCSESFLTDLPPVRKVACGQHHTVVITRDNQLFAWGDNKYGQLGLDPEKWKIVTTPAKVENGAEVNDESKIYCGWTHTCLFSRNTAVFSWGRNSYGQLGRPKDTPASECWKAGVALKLCKPLGQHSMSVGSEHNVVLSGEGIVFAWGWNEHGNCGTGTKEDIFTPTEVQIPKLPFDERGGSVIGSGAGHSFALVFDQ